MSRCNKTKRYGIQQNKLHKVTEPVLLLWDDTEQGLGAKMRAVASVLFAVGSNSVTAQISIASGLITRLRKHKE